MHHNIREDRSILQFILWIDEQGTKMISALGHNADKIDQGDEDYSIFSREAPLFFNDEFINQDSTESSGELNEDSLKTSAQAVIE